MKHSNRIYRFNKTEIDRIFSVRLKSVFATFLQNEFHICASESGSMASSSTKLNIDSFFLLVQHVKHTKSTRITNLFIFISCIALTNKNHSILSFSLNLNWEKCPKKSEQNCGAEHKNHVNWMLKRKRVWDIEKFCQRKCTTLGIYVCEHAIRSLLNPWKTVMACACVVSIAYEA